MQRFLLMAISMFCSKILTMSNHSMWMLWLMVMVWEHHLHPTGTCTPGWQRWGEWIPVISPSTLSLKLMKVKRDALINSILSRQVTLPHSISSWNKLRNRSLQYLRSNKQDKTSEVVRRVTWYVTRWWKGIEWCPVTGTIYLRWIKPSRSHSMKALTSFNSGKQWIGEHLPNMDSRAVPP